MKKFSDLGVSDADCSNRGRRFVQMVSRWSLVNVALEFVWNWCASVLIKQFICFVCISICHTRMQSTALANCLTELIFVNLHTCMHMHVGVTIFKTVINFYHYVSNEQRSGGKYPVGLFRFRVPEMVHRSILDSTYAYAYYTIVGSGRSSKLFVILARFHFEVPGACRNFPEMSGKFHTNAEKFAGIVPNIPHP